MTDLVGRIALRVEFLLKTDGGYPRDAGVFFGGEGGEEAGHVPTGVTYVTEKHSFLVKGTLTHLALRIIRGGAGKGGNEGRYGPGRA